MGARGPPKRGYRWAILMNFIAGLLLARRSHAKESGPALFVFGDSTVDTGTNSYINTSADFRSNYAPYGQDYFGKPTGRFSNGRVVVDFIDHSSCSQLWVDNRIFGSLIHMHRVDFVGMGAAEYAGIPLIPPYLQPDADYSHGVNFGSGGGGVLNETNHGLVVDFKTQIVQFGELQEAIIQNHGEVYANKLFTEAVYLISMGSNDYLGYFGNPAQRQKYTPEQLVGAVVTGIAEGIQTLYMRGARKLMVFGVGPLGCLPAMRAAAQTGGCIDAASDLGAAHNGGMNLALDKLQAALPDFAIMKGHFFGFLLERLEDPSTYEFKDALKACCGAGPYGGGGPCGRVDENTGENYELCSNANEHIWWDPYHPSEGLHEQFAKTVWNGAMPYVEPFNANQLFKQSAGPLCSDGPDAFIRNPIEQVLSQSIS